VRRLALALGLAAACTGTVGDPLPQGGGTAPTTQPMPGGPANPMPGTTPAPGAPPPAGAACPGPDMVGRRALRRLTIPELEATIRATFGLDAKQWQGLTLPSDAGSDDGFTNNIDQLTVSPEYARGALESSRKVAALVSSDPMLGTLLPCAASGGPSCADTFVTSFGTKLYRRPLTPAEKARYLALYDKTSAEGFRSFVYWATSTMLQSPHVIYRSELGEPDGNGRFKLTAYEVASLLSYTFTGGPPGADLMQLAAQNKLSTAADVQAAARGLVFDGANVRPAFRDVVLRFTDQWLGLSHLGNVKKDAALYPDFSSTVQASMAEETRRFISAVVLEDRGKVTDLFTAPYTLVDATLARYYGFGTGGAGFVRVNRPAEWGVGLLAQGSLLSVGANSLSTSPTRRGHLIRTGMLCNVVPPPPPVVDPIPEPTEARTTRQRYEEIHGQNPSCKSCHQMMDQIGFAFEHLDAAGRYRAREGKFDIDDSAVVSGTSQGDLRVQGPAALARAIAPLPEVNDCLAAYLAAYALGVAHDSARCLVGSATADLRAGGSIVDFYVAMARSDHFRLRQ
jgi:hypothetical protein